MAGGPPAGSGGPFEGSPEVPDGGGGPPSWGGGRPLGPPKLGGGKGGPPGPAPFGGNGGAPGGNGGTLNVSRY